MQDSPHTPIPDQATMPPPVALRADQELVFAAPTEAALAWYNAGGQVEAAQEARLAGIGALAVAVAVFLAYGAAMGDLAYGHGHIGAVAAAPALCISAILVAGAIWLWNEPRAWVLTTIGILAMAAAAWLALAFGQDSILLTAVLLYWGTRRLIQARRAQEALQRETNPAMVQETRRVVEELQAHCKCDDVVELDIGLRRRGGVWRVAALHKLDFGRGRLLVTWRVMLLRDVAVFTRAGLGGISVVVLPRQAVIINLVDGRVGWVLRVEVVLPDVRAVGEMNDAHYRRYCAWQAGGMPDEVRATINSPNR